MSSRAGPLATRPRFRGLPIRPANEGTGLLPWSWAEERLELGRAYWLATTRPDGSPHTMPVWGVWLDRSLVFDTHPRSQKICNLGHDSRAVAHVESSEEVVIVEGIVDVDEEFEASFEGRYHDACAAKYGIAPLGGFRLEPHVAYAWDNADFTGSATRFAFLAGGWPPPPVGGLR